MKPVVKVLVAGCAILVVMGIVAAMAIGWYIKSKGPELAAQVKAIRTDGATFGHTASEPQCVDEALARYRKGTGIVAGARQSVWLGGCLETSSIDPEFCTNVPAETQFTRTITWRVARCKDLGFGGDSTCPNILAAVQRYCDGAVRKKKMSAAP